MSWQSRMPPVQTAGLPGARGGRGRGDSTDTHTVAELVAAAGQPVPGVALVFDRQGPTLRAYRVERARKIGREESMDIVIDDGKVSRFHAEVAPTHGGVVVTDAGSRNGTYVAGRRVGPDRMTAPFGSVIRIGRALLIAIRDVRPFEVSVPGDASLVGGPSLDSVRRAITNFGRGRIPVLIRGETGTGKELVARALHAASGREGPFLAVNCAALPMELVESELFGHRRGAFSGSEHSRRGLFRSADGGTLLLDEIGDLPLDAQAKLLRVLETGEVRAVGEDKARPVDVRVIAATNRDLGAMMAIDHFREDLFHRIATVQIELPPMRDRPEDVPLLVGHFLENSGVEVSVFAMERMIGHRWPGNVRELKNTLAGAIAAARSRESHEIQVEDVDDLSEPLSVRREDASDEQQKARIVAALEASAGNVSQAARDLGMRRARIYELLTALAIDPAEFRRR
jgi:transcriptional regulator of acetoin/glycerol metabolism